MTSHRISMVLHEVSVNVFLTTKTHTDSYGFSSHKAWRTAVHLDMYSKGKEIQWNSRSESR